MAAATCERGEDHADQLNLVEAERILRVSADAPSHQPYPFRCGISVMDRGNEVFGKLLAAHQRGRKAYIFLDTRLVSCPEYPLCSQPSQMRHQRRIGAIRFSEAERQVVEHEP